VNKSAAFHPEAETEFLAAMDYYGRKSGELAERFVAEITRVVGAIEAQPRRQGLWRHGTRRLRTRHFPYLVIFAERPTTLYIVAVAHIRQHPGYWVKRLD
jgi:toxin ParE1/3/4